jgi:hypothetical protein
MRPAVRRALTPLVPGVDRFGLVLGLLVLSYLVFALGGSSTPRILEGSSAVALWLALHASAVGPRVRLWAAAMLLAAFLAVVVITQSVADSTARGLSELWFVVVFLLTLIAVLRRVLIHQEVTLETICGALSAYLLLGLMFSAVYGAMADLGDQQLFVQVAEPGIPLRQYFSFTTLTTWDTATSPRPRTSAGRSRPSRRSRPDLPRDAHRAPRRQLRSSPLDRLSGELGSTSYDQTSVPAKARSG